MCLTVPMRVEEISGMRARCAALGETRWAELLLLDRVPEVGEYLAISLGYAQRVVPEAEALEAQRLFAEMGGRPL